MRAIITVRFAWVAAACAALFMLRCADLSGGGSEAGNARITGRVLDSHGLPASKVMVTLLPSDFDPVKKTPSSSAYLDTTGPDGTFGLSVQKDRTYTIQIVLISIRTRALVAGLVVGDSDITAPECTLKVPGAVKVMLSGAADKTSGYLYVPGTSILAFFNNDNDFAILDSVPAGTIPAVSYSSKSSSASSVIRYLVPVPLGDTVIVYNPSWKYTRQLRLNTTTSGANVTGDVMNFPVLIRLNNSNFVFSQAQPTGADIRFSKPDNTLLPYEIERWDGAAGSAEIWVRVDTVRGDNTSQNIIMFWGNPDAASLSKGAVVFDTASGFAGVWQPWRKRRQHIRRHRRCF